MKNNLFYFGRISAVGGGEVVATVYNKNGASVGEAHGVNGTQPEESAYFPTIEEWLEGKNMEAMSSIESEGAICCPRCKCVLSTYSDQQFDEAGANGWASWVAQLEEGCICQQE